MNRRNEQILLGAAFLSIACLLVDHLLWIRTRLSVLPALYPYMVLAAVVSAALWCRLRFHRLAEEEIRDESAARKRDTSSSLFDRSEEEEDPISFVHARRQYERWFVPSFAPLFVLLFGYWGWRLYAAAGQPMDEPTQRLFAASFLIGQSFALFLFGRYLLGLSRIPDNRLLRGAGVLILLAALGSVFSGIAAIIAEVAWPPADLIARQILSIYLLVLAAEYLINTIGWLYRPKRVDRSVTTYESRLSGLLTDPVTWTSGIAQTIDYQFGFQVSETGAYRFIRRALLPLVLVQVLLLYALSCVVVLGPEEEAILERFGQPAMEDGEPVILTGGLHLKRPWPFDTVRRHPARRIQVAHIGYIKDPDEPRPPLMLWTRPHYLHEEPFVVASRDLMARPDTDDAAVPVNFITVNVPIEYRITNLYHYVYNHADPDAVLRMLAYRGLTRELAGRDLIELLGEERREAGAALHAYLQQAVDEQAVGIQIVFAGLHGAHPPIPVAPAFESVIGSLEERETSVLEARAYENRILPLAHAEADELGWLARADRARRVDTAQADADLFMTRLAIHEELPRVYTSRLYLDSLRRALMPVRKYVVAVSPDLEVIILNAEERLRPDLLDFGPGRGEDRFL